MLPAGFGAHIGGAFPTGKRFEVQNSFSEFLAFHVMAIRKRLAPSAKRRKMGIENSQSRKQTGKPLHIELRLPLRNRITPYINKKGYPRRAENFSKFIYRMNRVTGRKYLFTLFFHKNCAILPNKEPMQKGKK